MRTLQQGLAVAGLLLIPILALGADPAEIEVKVGTTRNLKGAVGCLLFKSEDGFPKEPAKAVAKERIALSGNHAVCRFTGVAAGSYAVSAIHDEDGDNELDTNFVGIPTEGYGASNNKLPSMSAPSFEDSRFTVASGEKKQLTINLKY
jgi:uncharacterized protein (DUF2141 family)